MWIIEGKTERGGKFVLHFLLIFVMNVDLSVKIQAIPVIFW